MQSWKDASCFERVQFQAISGFLAHRPGLVQFLFNRERPQLNLPPEEIISMSQDFCTSDQILIKLAVNLWCDYGGISFSDMFYLDYKVFHQILDALHHLGPKPSKVFEALTKLINEQSTATEVCG